MVFFLLISAFLFFLAVISLFKPTELFNSSLWNSFLKGMLTFALLMIIYAFLRNSIPVSFTPGRLFLFVFFHDHAFVAILSIGGFFLLNGRNVVRDVRSWEFFRVFAFFSGVYSLSGIVDIILYFGEFDAYRLFLIPCMRLILVSALSLVFYKAIDETGLLRIAYSVGCLAVPVATSLISFFYMSNYLAVSIVVFILLFGGSGTCMYFMQRKNLRFL